MTKQRWYDKDPTLSLAISILESAPKNAQLETVQAIFKELGCKDLLNDFDQRVHDPRRVAYLFPKQRRRKLEAPTQSLLEVLKRLPSSIQTEMALSILVTYPAPFSHKLLSESYFTKMRQVVLEHQYSY